MYLTDTHVHLNFETFQEDLEGVAQRWREAGVVRLIHSCVEPSEFGQIQAIADRFPEVFFAVGLHPLDVEEKWTPDVADQIIGLATLDQRVVAIGETGLDLFKASNFEQQVQAFEAHLKIAQQLDKPVIIHCRDAASPMAEVLRHFCEQNGSVKGVMHCWGGNLEETRWFLDLGFYISFSGTVTFNKAIQIQESAQAVPPDRLLIETDCPFLAPVPNRGKRNEPAYVKYVAEKVAQLRNVSVEELALLTTHNASQLFRLPLPHASPAQVALV